MNRRMFDEDDRYGNAAMDLDLAIHRAVEPIMLAAAKEDWSMRDIELIASCAVRDVALGWQIFAGDRKRQRGEVAAEGKATQPSCQKYRRPAGVLGGPCLNCGRPQPDHSRMS